MSGHDLQRAWRVVSENRIRAAQAEGEFEDLAGFGRPLEELMDINDPNGWIRRTIRDSVQTPEKRASLRRVCARTHQSP